MIRKIIKIDQDKCIGCGLCATTCHEGAIGMKDGKAVLLREDYCDGLGDCLPACPVDAISFEEREALAYDEEAVKQAQAAAKIPSIVPFSSLHNWPVQIKLAAPNSPQYKNADLLIAADCVAYAYGTFHQDFMQNKVTLIGCTKLDNIDYSEKLMQIFATNPINSITVVKMEVPCCSGMENAVRKALVRSKKKLPLEIVTISTDGMILSRV